MNSPEPALLASQPPRIRKRYVFLALFLTALVVCGLGIVSLLRLSADTRALRDAAVKSVAGQCEKKIALHLGGFTTGLARAIASFFDVEPEVRAGLQALRGAEVGVYELRGDLSSGARAEIVTAVDREMEPRGWMRAVTVMEDDELVAIYFPAESFPPHKMRCALVVLEDEHLVIASVRGNIEPLVELARKKIDIENVRRQCKEFADAGASP
jgi:hypothetical protein